MTARRKPTKVWHFTAIEHLETLLKHGLLSDNAAQQAGVLTTEVGNLRIKEARRRQSVPHSPGGVVADYVPFYFAPRSPMMYSISCGNVPSYRGGTEPLMYLLSTLERLYEVGPLPLLTDRNASLAYTRYRHFDPADLVADGFIDWSLMDTKYWANTPDEPDRRERRMAEALVHHRVPWEAITHIATRSQHVADEVLARLGAERPSVPVLVRPNWYF